MELNLPYEQKQLIAIQVQRSLAAASLNSKPLQSFLNDDRIQLIWESAMILSFCHL